jgi:glycosyltransferase involved in cell wall biosynthesis
MSQILDGGPQAVPAISILMAMRDAAETVDECLESISAQTFRSFELIVIDDGSTDDAPDRVAARSRSDRRIRLQVRRRRGLVPALNEGLALCRAPIVARMDADDRMRPRRLERQLKFFAANPGLDVVGSRVYAFPRRQVGTGMREYLRWQNACLSPEAIDQDIYIESPLTQPSVAFRRDVVRALGGYRDGDFPEDYELWLRLVQAGRRLGKCPEVLLDWRQRKNSYSRTNPRFSKDAFDRLRATYLCRDPRLNCGRPLVFWGAGRVTRKRCRHLTDRGYLPQVWIDIDPRKIGNRILGVPVVAPEWLASAEHDGNRPLVLAYVANHGARDLIARRLEEFSYRRGVDYLMIG